MAAIYTGFTVNQRRINSDVIKHTSMDDGGGSFLGTASAPLHKPYLCNIKVCFCHCFDPKVNDVTLKKQLNLTNGSAKI